MTRAERPGARTGAPRGYVLLSVLAALVVLSLVALRLDDRVEQWRGEQGAWSRWTAAEAQLASARDELLACLLTQPLGPRGFGSEDRLVRVDGRSYQLPSGIEFSVQDARGLISVAEPQPDLMRRYLAARGLPPGEVEALIDALADYVDGDTLRRLNGAEAPAYAEAGLPPPRNEWLASPYELRSVYGWHRRPELWVRASDTFSAVRHPWVNPNTAPLEVLRALPGATPEGVEALLSVREQRQIVNAADLLSVSGIVLADDLPQFNPGTLYRLRLWQPEATRMLEYTVMLTLTAPSQPWALLEVRQLPRRPDDANAPAYSAPRGEFSPSSDRRPGRAPLACGHVAPG